MTAELHARMTADLHARMMADLSARKAVNRTCISQIGTL